MNAECRFADLIPEQRLETFALDGNASKSNIWENAYDGGFDGVYLDRHINEDGTVERDTSPLGNAANWYRNEFADIIGKDSYKFEMVFDSLAVGNDTETGYVASVDAFTAWARDKHPDVPDWLFGFLQNSGNCVGSAGVEMMQGLIGSRAMDPACREKMAYLIAMWAYMFRGYCGGGWYMGAHAAVTAQYGYAFARQYTRDELPNTGPLDYAGEQDSEDLTVTTWCTRQPDDFINLVASNGWFFEEGAITEFSGGLDALKQVICTKGQIHHGSNYTSAGGVDKVRRIGAHAQTMFGGRWDDHTLKFYNDKGYRFNTDNFPCVNHQTWGNWSGACPDDLWCYGHDDAGKTYSWTEAKALSDAQRDSLTQLFGPKPQGAWVVGAEKQMKYFGDGYVYLPKMKGIPDDGPAPPPTPTESKISGELEGEILEDGRVRLNGTLTAEGVEHIPVWSGKSGSLQYKFVPKI
jgi:hypothetical protein